MDAIDNVFDPLREFAKDSVRLVKRCHKPDRKGKSLFPFADSSFLELSMRFWGNSADRCVDPVCSYFWFFGRVFEGGCAYGDRFRGDGIRRVLRQAHLHPHQQHHRRIWLDSDYKIKGKLSDSCFFPLVQFNCAGYFQLRNRPDLMFDEQRIELHCSVELK